MRNWLTVGPARLNMEFKTPKSQDSDTYSPGDLWTTSTTFLSQASTNPLRSIPDCWTE